MNEFIAKAKALLGNKRVFTDHLRRLAWGTDAGFYRLVPQVVVMPKTEEQVSQLMRLASDRGIGVTFRAAGTSLSGQAITDQVLMVAGKDWEGYQIAPDHATIKLQPGIIGQRVNEILAPYGKMFSPDPASKKSAMVGGIIANNASGMNCGTHANSDRIMRSVRIVLADGTVLDTADPQSRQAFQQSHAQMLQQLMDIRRDIMADPQLAQRIRHKYSIKCVTGLNLLPFILYDDPFEIIAHLMVGSEGTLAFLSEATVATADIAPYSASALVYFTTMEQACQAVVALKRGPVDSAEMLDYKSLEAVNDDAHQGLTALLLETKANDEATLGKNIAAIDAILAPFATHEQHVWKHKPDDAPYWQMRSGVFPAVGGMRPAGTTVLIEDIAFHIDDLPQATVKLQQLLADQGYDDACIYGHALEGNYHFVIAQRFDNPAEVERYKRLMHSVEELVLSYDGSLKAEHGTGRNMAPFVEHEWGPKAMQMMRRIKRAFDPKGLLNAGVIFNDDPDCYVKNIKELPLLEKAITSFSHNSPRAPRLHEAALADRCIECGFCEVNCMSCGYTLSARQRIVALRHKASGGAIDGFGYLGNDTCAGDGLCSTSCPMGINVGELMHDIRNQEHRPGTVAHAVGNMTAKHLGLLSSGIKLGLPLARLLPYPFAPLRPLHGKLADSGVADQHRVVYMPSCINRTFGAAPGDERPLVEVMVELCNKANYGVVFPEGLNNLCCGMIWASKGEPDIADRKSSQTIDALLAASDGGALPVVIDQSPCLHHLREYIKRTGHGAELKIYEPSEFIDKYLAPHLVFNQQSEPVAVHVTCSTKRMGLADTIVGLARRCATTVVVPAEVGCCGFAGDKGFMLPGLNAWGLRKLRPELLAAPRPPKTGYSNSRTCEIGLTRHGGIPYKSIVYLVNNNTKQK